MTVTHCIDHSPLSKVRGKFYHSGAMLEIPPGAKFKVYNAKTFLTFFLT